LDIRYATPNNFLHRAVYPQARCFLVKEAALKLNEVQKELQSIGLGLKIFDGYRPLSVQKKMWEIMPNPNYVANPKHGSRHNRGSAVDLTLVDSSGHELEMPTGFDDFTPRAHHDYMKLPARVRINRWILRTVMEKHGFKPIRTEWWHYDLKNWRKYPVMDFSFEQLDQMIKKNRHRIQKSVKLKQ
jgi:D-alanyl-D-alanine dipeptidase